VPRLGSRHFASMPDVQIHDELAGDVRISRASEDAAAHASSSPALAHSSQAAA